MRRATALLAVIAALLGTALMLSQGGLLPSEAQSPPEALSSVTRAHGTAIADWSEWVNSNTMPAVTLPSSSVGSVTARYQEGCVQMSWQPADGEARSAHAATKQSGATYTMHGADTRKTYVSVARAIDDGGESSWTDSYPTTYDECAGTQ